MADVEAMIHRYVACWNEPDAETRHGVIAEVWSADGVYRNASTTFQGRSRVEQAVKDAYDAFVVNGYRFRVASVQLNHDAVRYRWEMLPVQGGDPDSVGTHMAMLGEDGRLISDHQFIDRPPSGR